MKRLIRLPEVLSTTGLSRSRVYDLIKQHKFPPAIHSPLFIRQSVWDADLVQDWVAQRIAEAAHATPERQEVGQRLLEAKKRKAAARHVAEVSS